MKRITRYFSVLIALTLPVSLAAKEITPGAITGFIAKHPQKATRAIKNSTAELRALRGRLDPTLDALAAFPQHLRKVLEGIIGFVGTANLAIDAFLPSLSVFEQNVASELTDLDSTMQQNIGNTVNTLAFTKIALKQITELLRELLAAIPESRPKPTHRITAYRARSKKSALRRAARVKTI